MATCGCVNGAGIKKKDMYLRPQWIISSKKQKFGDSGRPYLARFVRVNSLAKASRTITNLALSPTTPLHKTPNSLLGVKYSLSAIHCKSSQSEADARIDTSDSGGSSNGGSGVNRGTRFSDDDQDGNENPSNLGLLQVLKIVSAGLASGCVLYEMFALQHRIIFDLGHVSGAHGKWRMPSSTHMMFSRRYSQLRARLEAQLTVPDGQMFSEALDGDDSLENRSLDLHELLSLTSTDTCCQEPRMAATGSKFVLGEERDDDTEQWEISAESNNIEDEVQPALKVEPRGPESISSQGSQLSSDDGIECEHTSTYRVKRRTRCTARITRPPDDCSGGEVEAVPEGASYAQIRSFWQSYSMKKRSYDEKNTERANSCPGYVESGSYTWLDCARTSPMSPSRFVSNSPTSLKRLSAVTTQMAETCQVVSDCDLLTAPSSVPGVRHVSSLELRPHSIVLYQDEEQVTNFYGCLPHEQPTHSTAGILAIGGSQDFPVIVNEFLTPFTSFPKPPWVSPEHLSTPDDAQMREKNDGVRYVQFSFQEVPAAGRLRATKHTDTSISPHPRPSQKNGQACHVMSVGQEYTYQQYGRHAFSQTSLTPSDARSVQGFQCLESGGQTSLGSATGSISPTCDKSVRVHKSEGSPSCRSTPRLEHSASNMSCTSLASHGTGGSLSYSSFPTLLGSMLPCFDRSKMIAD